MWDQDDGVVLVLDFEDFDLFDDGGVCEDFIRITDSNGVSVQ